MKPHLQKLVDAALAPPSFDPATSERSLRLGLADSAELWLLPRLLRVLEKEAPKMRVVADEIRAVRPRLKTKPLPFEIHGSYSDLLWPVATDDDEPCRFVRSKIVEIARASARS